MINLGDKKARKVISSVIIIIIVLAMVGGTLLAGLAF